MKSALKRKLLSEARKLRNFGICDNQINLPLYSYAFGNCMKNTYSIRHNHSSKDNHRPVIEETEEEREKRELKELQAKRKTKILEDFKRGYFFELGQIKKDPNGKVVEVAAEVTPNEESILFPSFQVQNLLGEDYNIRNRLIKKGRVSLVAICFRDFGARMLPNWISSFTQDTKDVDTNSRLEQEALQINGEDRYIVRKLLSIPIKSGLKNVIDKSRHEKTFVYFGDGYEIRDDLGCDNRLVGHILLVDQEGKVRWRASGNPNEKEIQTMLECKAAIFQEYTQNALESQSRGKNHNNSNRKLTSNITQRSGELWNV